MMLLLRFIFWFAWLREHFNNHEWDVMLVIIKNERTLMMSKHWRCEMQFYFFYVTHALHIFWFVLCVFFTKNFFSIKLFRISMCLIREMHVLSKWLNRLIFMTMIVLHSQFSIFRSDFLHFEHSISISFESSSLASSLHSTLRTIQLKIIYLNVSRLISNRIFYIQHLIQFFLRHFYSWFGSIFVYRTRCSRRV